MGGLGRLTYILAKVAKHGNNVCALSLLKKYSGGCRCTCDLAGYGGGGRFGGLAGIVLGSPWGGRYPHEISSVSDLVSIFRNFFRFGRK